MINQSDVGDVATSQTKQKPPGAKREGRTPSRPQDVALWVTWEGLTSKASKQRTPIVCSYLGIGETHQGRPTNQETECLEALVVYFPSKSQLRCYYHLCFGTSLRNPRYFKIRRAQTR